MNLPTGTRGSMVALGILLIPLILVGNYLIAPVWNSYWDIREEISDGRFQLGRFTRIADNLPQLELASRELREQALLTPYLVPGQSRALAAANLQQHLREIAELHDARVMTMRVGKPKLDNAIEEVPIEARIQVPVEKLSSFLFDLESSRPLIFISKMEIRGRASIRRESTENTLSLVINLHGLRIPDEGSDRA